MFRQIAGRLQRGEKHVSDRRSGHEAAGHATFRYTRRCATPSRSDSIPLLHHKLDALYLGMLAHFINPKDLFSLR